MRLFTPRRHLYSHECARRCGFVVPLFYGAWWCPLLPRADVAVHTVVGAPLQLPRIAEPTAEQVTAYHALYVEALTRLFDDHKARFGYAHRRLEVI